MKLDLSTKILLDGADPQESIGMKELLGFLDGQTTNPTLLTKNPEVQRMIGEGEKFPEEELFSFYRKVINEISSITDGPISIEVYADKFTKAEEMVEQAREMARWISSACIKLPITSEGLKAASLLVKEGISVNMTLCFSQEQAAAVYAATKGAQKPVYVSPFVGRLDDKGEDGMILVKNIIEMYEKGDGHVLPLAASIRSLDHFLLSIKLSCPLVTVPFRIVKEWADKKFILPGEEFKYQPENLKTVPYEDIDLNKDWQDYNISHNLTDVGLEKFSADWKAVIK